MKFLICLTLILMGVFVEANPPNSDDNELEDRISSRLYKQLQSRIRDIEDGVRLIDTKGITNKVLGRIEVFQDGRWRKICIKGKKYSPKKRLAMAACQMLGYESAGLVLQPIERKLKRSGVSNYDYNCDGDEKTIFECGKQEKESECDEDGKTEWATAHCWSKREITTPEQ